MRSILAAILFLGATLIAGAQDVPDFTGSWTGKFQVIVMGRDATSEGQVQEVTITYELSKQSGRLLWGTVLSDKTEKRPIVLAFSLNGGTLVGSDTAGFHRLTVISANRMESCFTDNGTGSIIATCGLIQKAQ